jgi:hypothetical protein
MTANKEVYDINTLDRLTEYWNNGTIVFAIQGLQEGLE